MKRLTEKLHEFSFLSSDNPLVRYSLALVFLALDGNYSSRIIVLHSVDNRLLASLLTLKGSATNVSEEEKRLDY